MGFFHKGLLDVLSLALLWGPSFLFMKVAISEMTPLTLIALRVGVAGVILYGILKFKAIRVSLPYTLLFHVVVVGFFMNALPFVCFAYSLFYIPTSLSGLINGLTPILTILLASVFFEEERLTLNGCLGVLCGLSGLVILFLPALLGIGNQFRGLGLLYALVGAVSYAVGIVYAKRHIQGRCNPFMILPFQLLSAFVLVGLLAVYFETPSQILTVTSLKVWGSVFALGLFSTALAFILYYRILNRQGVTMLAMVTYLLPVVATILGVVFLNEKVGITFLFATIMILMGLLLVNRKVPEEEPLSEQTDSP